MPETRPTIIVERRVVIFPIGARPNTSQYAVISVCQESYEVGPIDQKALLFDQYRLWIVDKENQDDEVRTKSSSLSFVVRYFLHRIIISDPSIDDLEPLVSGRASLIKLALQNLRGGILQADAPTESRRVS